MKKRLSYLILIIISLLPFFITWFALPYFPKIIPSHYDLAGKPDDFSKKNMEYILATVFSMSGFTMLIIAMLVDKIHKDDEESTVNAAKNAVIIVKIGIAMMVFFLAMQCSELMNVYYYVTKKGDFPDMKIMNITLMLLFIYLGNIIIKSKRNPVMGIRTSWSNKSDEAWYISQKFGGLAVILSSILVIMVSLFLPNKYQLILLLVGSIFVITCSLIVSYKAVKKKNKKIANP